MLTIRRFKTTLLMAGLAAGLAGGTAIHAADAPKPAAAKPAETPPATATAPAKMELPFPDGEKWGTATEREKLAYLLGIMNMALAEYQLTGPDPKHRTIVPKMVKSLDGVTLRQMMGTVDTYYKANPDQQKRPIFEVIWFEIVAPKSGAKAQEPGAAAAKKG